jgi:hypothetical protein
MTPDNAEDFKQGAKITKLQLVGESAWALCLKSRCAKPLQHASSYVFWKVTVFGEIAEKVSRWEGMELREVRRMCFAVWEAEENGTCGAIQTLLALPKPGGDRLLAQTWATGSLGQHWHSW